MKNIIVVLVTLVAFAALTESAFAQAQRKKKFAEKHPRRAEVLRRANREEGKNDKAAAEGKITQDQANKLNQQDQAIKAEEQADARAHGGHITKQEQRDLNRQENNVNRERRAMEKADKAAGQPAAAPAAN